MFSKREELLLVETLDKIKINLIYERNKEGEKKTIIT